MKLSANGKEYTVEFTFEAAESDVVNKAFDYFSGAYMFKGIKSNKPEDEMTDEEKLQENVAKADAMISGISAVPRLAIDFLYMGLLENHGSHSEGDGAVTCRDDAKRIYKQFCKENPDDIKATQFGLFEALKEQMEVDGFFKRIGLEQLMKTISDPEPKKTPQDHKKKITNTKA